MLTAWLQQCGWTFCHTRWAGSTWQLSMTETPSIHSFIFLPHIRVQVVGAPVQAEKPSPATSSSSSWGTSSFSKASKEIQFLQQVLVLLPVIHARNTVPRRHLGDVLAGCLIHLKWLLLMWRGHYPQRVILMTIHLFHLWCTSQTFCHRPKCRVI